MNLSRSPLSLFIILRICLFTCSGAILNVSNIWCSASSFRSSGDARSNLIPLLMNIFLTPFIFLAFWSSDISLLFDLSGFLHSVQSPSQMLQSMPYMFTLGLVRSSMLPVKSGCFVSFFISSRIDFSDLEMILLPDVSVSEQKLQSPMHPLCVTMLNWNPCICFGISLLNGRE